VIFGIIFNLYKNLNIHFIIVVVIKYFFQFIEKKITYSERLKDPVIAFALINSSEPFQFWERLKGWIKHNAQNYWNNNFKNRFQWCLTIFFVFFTWSYEIHLELNSKSYRQQNQIAKKLNVNFINSFTFLCF